MRDEINGIELLTIHGSKGRQWPHVVLVACDEGALPHAQSLAVDTKQLERGEGRRGREAPGLRRVHPRPRAPRDPL